LDADWRILDHIYDCRSWSINGGNRNTTEPNQDAIPASNRQTIGTNLCIDF